MQCMNLGSVYYSFLLLSRLGGSHIICEILFYFFNTLPPVGVGGTVAISPPVMSSNERNIGWFVVSLLPKGLSVHL